MSGRMTVLEMVQNILSATEGDEVNSIGDTVDALMVAEEIKTAYYELFASRVIPSNLRLHTLEAVSDVDRPNYLKIPNDVQSIEWFKYKDEEGRYQEVRYLPPEEFLDRVTRFELRDPYMSVADLSNPAIQLNIVTDKQPQFWTTFDNRYLVVDGFNSGVDSTLQESKTLCRALSVPDFVLTDDFTPDLDVVLFPLLLAEAKKAVFVNQKGVTNANEERRARRQLVRTQNDLWRADQRRPYNRTPNYGRRR